MSSYAHIIGKKYALSSVFRHIFDISLRAARIRPCLLLNFWF
ncbi:hypothetical protein TREAZ_1671 [Leadbettera azotonutricia ZAS-9]|uniref:Uncharacterized protein n=1 Tax=Leadbettera azotonutricia (strain ATCC BAA-888 / DSM 13862 / ZAS-9) TaxID=545695 RepID=F5YD86_LEAAZ|nr:hypothetical protein TREAZ_1671 [Leadbettera azotonutricia ZAS-9]